MKSSTITLKYEWDMGHRLPLHDGKCARLHGHRYVAEVDLTGPLQEHGPATGMVVDFYVLKQVLKDTIEFWDHRTMLWAGDPVGAISREEILPTVPGICSGDSCDDEVGIFRVGFMPTAENIAREVLRLVSSEISSAPDVWCSRVRIYETPNGWAEARP